MIAAQTALQLTQMRPGHNTPLLDDARARQDILGFQPEDIERSITEQTLREQLRSQSCHRAGRGQRLGLELAKRQSATLSPEEAASASPAFQQAAAGSEPVWRGRRCRWSPASEPRGKIDGRRMAESRTRDRTRGKFQGVGGGLPTGAPQPMQVMGRTAQVMQGSQLG